MLCASATTICGGFTSPSLMFAVLEGQRMLWWTEIAGRMNTESAECQPVHKGPNGAMVAWNKIAQDDTWWAHAIDA